jgi:altronate dehydratase
LPGSRNRVSKIESVDRVDEVAHEVAAASARNSADMFPALDGLTLISLRSAGGAAKITRRD